MKFMHKVVLSLMAIMALAPASMQANRLTRALAQNLAQNVTKQAAMQALKNPAFITAAIGAASLAYSKWQDKKAENSNYDLDGDSDNEDFHLEDSRAMKRKKAEHKTYAKLSGIFGSVLLGFAGNYLLLSQLKQAGYLPKLATRKAKIGLSLLSAAASLEFWKKPVLKSIMYNADNSSAAKQRAKKFEAIYQKSYPWIGAEMILGPLAYLALCA